MTIQQYRKLKVPITRLVKDITDSATAKGIDISLPQFELTIERAISNFLGEQGFTYDEYIKRKTEDNSIQSAIDEGQVVKNAEMVSFIHTTDGIIKDLRQTKDEVITETVKALKKTNDFIETAKVERVKWDKITDKPKVHSQEEIKGMIDKGISAIPQGKTGDEIALEASRIALEEAKTLIPNIQDIADELPQLGSQVRDGLELLEGEERLDKSAIKGLDDYEEVKKLAKEKGGTNFGAGLIKELVAGTGVTIDNSNLGYPKISSTGSGAESFTDLDDVPSAYTGQGGKVVAVKVDVSGLEFISATSTDEKVKYDASDPTAGYVADKVIAGTGITVAEGSGADENKLKITNSAPDQTVALSNGTGISVSGTYPNFTITNSSPDQTVALSNGTGITTSGTYPNFTITNSLPDQTVALSNGTGITTSGTYPNFTITNSAPFVDAASDGSTYGRKNGAWSAIVAGAGDMLLGTEQTVTALKTFDKDKLAMKGTSTGTNIISVANTSATSYTNTLPARDFTFDNITTGTTTNGTGFLKGNGTVISFDNSTYLTSVGTGVANEITYWSGTNTLGSLATATYPSLTELSYVKGLTSSMQPQLDGKNPYHGVVARPVGATNPLPTSITTTPVFTLGATANNISYYYQGNLVLVDADKSCVLDDQTGATTTSGVLVSGKYYELVTYVAGDDFSNIDTVIKGTSNTTGCVFLATGTTPTTWTNGSSVRLLNNSLGLYWVQFYNGTGEIIANKLFPGFAFNSNVTIATVLWNGTNYGLVSDERHGYNRNKPWHEWAHNTVGCRYRSGLTLTHNSGTGAAATFATTAGEIDDEDIQFAISASSTFPTANTGRLFYQTAADAYAFINTPSAIPGYLGANSRPNYVRSDTYALVQMTSAVNRYINVFVYATTDLHTPISFVTETVSATVAENNGYSSVTAARAAPFPNLTGLATRLEIKPLYRLIWRADGVLQAINTTLDDYRTVTSLPMGAGTVSTTASAVTFNPYGTIESGNVQGALQELSDETVPCSKVGTSTALMTELATGFTLEGGTTKKTLTVALDASVSGTNTGDNAANTSIAATKLDDFATPDNNTDLNANTTNHGLLLVATAPAAGLTNVVAIENGETVYKNKALFDATSPSTQAFGDAAAVGSAVVAARRDHKHAMMANPVSGTANEIAYLATTGTVGSLAVATYPSLTELSYVKGLSSAVQTQITARATSASPTFTGTITLSDNARVDLTLPTADTYCTGNTTDSFTSGYSSAIGDLVFFGSSGKWLEVDADAVATCQGLMGIALEAKTDTQAMKVALPGSFVRLDAWNWTVGATLYAGETLGAMQETIPTGADAIIKVVGFAVSADVIFFNPSPDQQSTVA